jgi:TonB family protein
MLSRPERAVWACAIAVTAMQPATGAAQAACDCMTVVDSCEAQVVLRDAALEISAGEAQCARVDYFVDGMPFVAVVGGEPQRLPLRDAGANARVVVQSCQICRAVAPARDPAPTAAAAGDAALEPLIEVTPEYPPEAQARGLDGQVEVAFTVDAEGAVSEATVVSAEPAGQFDAAALAAVRRSRYAAEPGRAPQQLTRTLRFRFDDYVWRLPTGTGSAAAATAAAPANQCLRESVSYDFGDSVEVGMVNACADPIAVFGCAEGVRGEQGRWACSGSDETRNLLAARDDERLGSRSIVSTASGASSFELVDEYFVLRAPNSEIWWIACRADDVPCQSRARQWVRALDGQIASIDPRDRTELALARAH